MFSRLLLAVSVAWLGLFTPGQATELPRVTSVDGRHVLLVDGRPYLVLGAQINNSSNYGPMLPSVWPVIAALHANTVEAPVTWEQIEPVEGRFDFKWIDALLAQARRRHVRLTLLWFGAWKNGESNYAPEWVKRDQIRFPRLMRPGGAPTLTLSPFGEATLAAEVKPFRALMAHLRRTDKVHTVILVQVENEVGSKVARDYSPVANALFAQAVPEAVVQATSKPAGTWQQAFGPFAEQYFSTWGYARYMEAVAAAGKAELALPMYANAAVFDPVNADNERSFMSGAPAWNVIPIWKAVAPSLDFLSPDLYIPGPKIYAGFLNRYDLPNNGLMIVETGNAIPYARYFWSALGHGAIGWAPFGMDDTGYTNFPFGPRTLDAATLDAFAAPFALFAPMARKWSEIASTHPTWGTVRGTDLSDDTTVMGAWRITAQYGMNMFGERGWGAPPPWADQPVGGAVVAQLGEDEFLVAGRYARLRLAPVDPKEIGQILSVEEGTYVHGEWRMRRRWNGDQIDYGFNFAEKPTMLRVRMMRTAG